MSRKLRFMAFVAAIIMTLPVLLSGCWDNEEIDELFIVTGIALDTADTLEQIELTLQIGQVKQDNRKSSQSSQGGGASEFMIVNTSNDTVLGGFAEFNRDSRHKLMLHHNQALLFGADLAAQGIKKHLDIFLRDQQARLEVPIIVVDGRADEILKTRLKEEVISGMFLKGMFEDLAKVSVQYRERLIDFISKLIDDSSAPVAPIIKIEGEEDNRKIVLSGMAVFREDRMIGSLSNDQVLGYIFAKDKVKRCEFTASDNQGTVVIHIVTLQTKKRIKIDESGKVKLSLEVVAAINLGEVRGFLEIPVDEELEYISKLAEEEIKSKIISTFNATQFMQTDIYGFGRSVNRLHPKKWREMKENWENIYSQIELEVDVKAKVAGTGQINLPLDEY